MLALLIAAAALPPLAEQTRCVAVLAIVSAEQERGVAEANDRYPPLGTDGARFAAAVQASGVGRGAVVAEIAALQREAKATEESGLPDPALVGRCVAMMKAVAPPPPPPGLPRCAAMLAVARDDVEAREGLSARAKDLATLASVLDWRARAELRAEGRSGDESDRALAAAREGITAEAIEQGEFDQCVEQAAP